MMKILFAATVDIHIINHHLRIIHELHEQGNLIDVAANGTYTNDDIHQKYNVCFSKSPTSLDNLKAYRFMKQLLKKEDYDIISTHTPLASFFTRMAAEGLRTKVIYTAHGFHFYQGAPLKNQLIYRNMERLAAHHTDRLVTINQEDYKAAQQFHYRPGGHAVYIPGVGVDLSRIEAARTDRRVIRKRLGLPEDAFVMISVGELNQNKNHLFVMNALQKELREDPMLYYVICGTDLWHGTYAEKIKELGLEGKVMLLGYRNDIYELLYGMDLFLCPSFREGLPVCVIEAMAAGVPVIASDVRGNHDLIESGADGYLYPVNDAELFRKEYHTLRRDPAMREAFIRNAEQRAHQYSKETIDPMILELYEELKPKHND